MVERRKAVCRHAVGAALHRSLRNQTPHALLLGSFRSRRKSASAKHAIDALQTTRQRKLNSISLSFTHIA
ncbi:MAG: hypothetical protein ACJA2J_002367 [Candidatus Azotimanducaceae bacterium]